MGKLFGTDGIRGVANEDLTSDFVRALGRAAGSIFGGDGPIVIGRDTRLSGPMLEEALVSGLTSAGTDVLAAGICPTPAVSFLTRKSGAIGGAVISASHNPVEDNGIKFFGPDGAKLDDELELRIEDELEVARPELATRQGTRNELNEAEDLYVEHVTGSIDSSLNGLKVVVDCAFGAAWRVGPRALRAAGADVIAINAEADGSRINVDCGSTNLGPVAEAVRTERAAVGIAFDGDADRALAVDESGTPVSGDNIIGLAARRLRSEGHLANDLVVVTVMSNLGFIRHLEERGIKPVVTAVGDRNVARVMSHHGAVLGGEQSGHVIFSEFGPSGDGIVTALQLLQILVTSGEPMSELAHFFEPFPQVLRNVPVDDGLATDDPALEVAIRAAEARLGTDGRVLVRRSGTEPVVRVMVEAVDPDLAESTADALVEVIRHRTT